MPAKLDLLPRKEFEITLEDGSVIKGQFGTWFNKRLCQRRTITYSQYLALKAEDWIDPALVSDMLLSAVEHSARKINAPFSYNDVHACGWVDELSTISVDALSKVIMHQFDTSELLMPPDSEKKTESLTGQNLNVNSTQLVEV